MQGEKYKENLYFSELEFGYSLGKNNKYFSEELVNTNLCNKCNDEK
jgi:hypothetical protein